MYGTYGACLLDSVRAVVLPASTCSGRVPVATAALGRSVGGRRCQPWRGLWHLTDSLSQDSRTTYVDPNTKTDAMAPWHYSCG